MDVLIVYHKTRINIPALDFVLSTLKGEEIKFTIVDRTVLSAKDTLGKDLIITVGGDGTLLRTSHFSGVIPILGFNSKPDRKEGFLTRTNIQQFKNHLQRLIRGTALATPLARIICTIDHKQFPLCGLNDIYIGPRRPYKLYNYEIDVDGRKEYQRSSGIIIATPIGTNGWIKSAGAKVIDYKKDPDCFEYYVREPYVGSLNIPPALVTGVLERGSEIRITPKSLSGILVFDSVSEQIRVKKNSLLSIRLCSTQVPLLEF